MFSTIRRVTAACSSPEESGANGARTLPQPFHALRRIVLTRSQQ